MRFKTFLVSLALVSSSAISQQLAPDRLPDLTLRFDVNLVQVDAVVTDHDGRHVPGLRADEFEVLQDGQLQRITNFSYVPAKDTLAADEKSPEQGTARLERSAVGRIMVILIHDEYLQFGDFVAARNAVGRFIEQGLQPGDLVSLRRTSGGSGAWEQFTADRKVLNGAVERLGWRPPTPLGPLQGLGVFGALRSAISALSQLPGRKSIVVIGPGMPTAINLYNDPNLSWIYDQIRRIGDEANRSSVTIQTIDARGLAIRPPSRETLAEGPYNRLEPCRQCAAIVNGGIAYTQSQDPYAFLAEITGGRFEHDNNDLFAQLREAVADSEGYYLIGWYPGPRAFPEKPKGPPKYHRIKVKVLSAGLGVRSREGYFAIPGTPKPLDFLSANQRMEDALFSPFASSDLDVRLTASVQYDDRLGVYVQSLLRVERHGVKFEEVPSSPGCRVANLELLVTPEPLDWRKDTKGRIDGVHSRMELCGKTLEQVLAKGFVVVNRSAIGQPGLYQMREGVRNTVAGEPPSVGPRGLLSRDTSPPVAATIGSANQLVEIPDLHEKEFALTGITLQSGTEGVPQSAAEFSYRPATDSDPAIRRFHGGESLAYHSRVLAGKSAPKQVVVRTQVSCDGQEVFTGQPATIATGSSVEGVFELAASTIPRRCVFGILAVDVNRPRYSAEQWIDFEALN